MKTLNRKSLLSGSRSVRHNTDLPGETAPVAAETKKSPAAKAAKKAAKSAEPGKKKESKKSEPKTAAKTAKAAKAPKEKKEPTTRKPRVEGRVDLVYRSGPERSLAIKVAEKHGHKVEKLAKVDNCTLGVTIGGSKAEALRTEYLSRRDAWRKAQDELIAKHIDKLG